MEARQGRDAAGGSMRYAHDSATGHVSWPGTHGLQGSMYKLMRQSSGNRFDSGCCGLADPAQPVRRPLRGAKLRAAGVARRAFPWRQAQRPVRGAKASRRVVRTQAGFRNRHPRRSRVQVVAPTTRIQPRRLGGLVEPGDAAPELHTKLVGVDHRVADLEAQRLPVLRRERFERIVLRRDFDDLVVMATHGMDLLQRLRKHKERLAALPGPSQTAIRPASRASRA